MTSNQHANILVLKDKEFLSDIVYHANKKIEKLLTDVRYATMSTFVKNAMMITNSMKTFKNANIFVLIIHF